jgi:CRISPR-associated exonuclease Cas4
MNTDLSRVNHPVAHSVMQSLQTLWRKRRGTTPYDLLLEAVERLRIIPSIAGRNSNEQARALGNIRILLERARSYHVRGLKQLAIDLSSEWENESPTDEAPADHQGNSIEIVTVHKAKGLEWPIVIPINFVTMPEHDEDFFFRSLDNSAHWTLGDVISSTIDAAVSADRAEAADESERLLYVACTRALDLLILPFPTWAPDGGWTKFFDLDQAVLDEIAYPTPHPPEPIPRGDTNDQSASIFASEREQIEHSAPRIKWHRPSLGDTDRESLDRATIDVGAWEGDSDIKAVVEGAGALRGIILHKLMEELLTRLLERDLARVTDRASALTLQAIVPDATSPNPSELAATALRTFSHKKLEPYIAMLVPEIPLFGARSDTVLVSARADAIAFEGGIPVAAFDWKSDVAPTPDDQDAYASQLLEYLELIGADKGAVVYMTSGEIRRLHRVPDASGNRPT